METTFNIYKSTDGVLRLDNYTASYLSEDWEAYLRETSQDERLERLLKMSSRNRSGKVYKIRRSSSYKEWQKKNVITVTSCVYGVATVNYDGRIPEFAIKNAVLRALKSGERRGAVSCTESNARKPAHLHMMYEFYFEFRQKCEKL